MFPLNQSVLLFLLSNNSRAEIPGVYFVELEVSCSLCCQQSRTQSRTLTQTCLTQNLNLPVSPGIRGILDHMLFCLKEVNTLIGNFYFGKTQMLSQWKGMLEYDPQIQKKNKAILLNGFFVTSKISMPWALCEEAAGWIAEPDLWPRCGWQQLNTVSQQGSTDWELLSSQYFAKLIWSLNHQTRTQSGWFFRFGFYPVWCCQRSWVESKPATLQINSSCLSPLQDPPVFFTPRRGMSLGRCQNLLGFVGLLNVPACLSSFLERKKNMNKAFCVLALSKKGSLAALYFLSLYQ